MTKNLKKAAFFLCIFSLLVVSSVKVIKPAFNPVNYEKDPHETKQVSLKTSQNYAPFIVGTGAGPHTIDPINCWDTASSDVIYQVTEGLFGYNLSDVNMPRIPLLATNYWWQDTTHLQITLRQGVTFHDGAVWNSTSAVWNFNRIMYLTNATGTLPESSPLAEPASLYFFNMTYNNDGVMNGGTPIIQSVTAVGAWNITFVLNAPFAPFLDLLCFEASFMVSPISTPADRFLNLNEKLVGTGPFTFDSFTPNVDVRFSRWEDYWQGMANIIEMVFSIISDTVTRNNAMLNHEIDYLISPIQSLIPSFEADSLITVKHFTDDTGIPGLSYYYLGFNNVLINETMRKAMSFAINYSYIINQMQLDLVVRANSPISPGFGSAYNASVIAADYNLAYARQFLVDAGVVPASMPVTNDTTGPNSNAWTGINIGSFNYSYNTDNSFRTNLYPLLQNWLHQIGVDIIDNGGTWDAFLDKLYVHHEGLGLYWVGWGPDYLDPFNLLDPLFNPATMSNSAQVNDPYLNYCLTLALRTTDQVARDNIYKHLQYYLANVLYPHAFGYHPKITIIHSANLTNVPDNSFGKHYFYPCKWIPQLAPLPAKIFIDDHDPNYNWTKTALENEWCTGSGTLNDPYLIKDLGIDGEGNYNGIEIHNSTAYFKIENCTIYNCESGIVLIETVNSIIINNSIYDFTFTGIQLEYSNNSDIHLNKISDFNPYYGIFLDNCSECNVYQNSIVDGFNGIVIAMSTDIFISDNDLIGNLLGIGIAISSNITINENYLFNNSYGIALQETDDNLVKNNQVIGNQDIGIFLMGYSNECYNNTIIGNNIVGNGILGINLNSLANHNTIFLNNFIGNALNALDNGTLNEWDNGVIGNYWDDYGGIDANGDGIGDTPYLVNEFTGSMDHYPKFYTNPFITVLGPNDDEIFGQISPNYNIEIIELNIDSIWYTMDDGLNNFTIESNDGIVDQLAWDALPDGPLTLTFYANNTEGQIGFAQVSVIKDTTSPIIVINEPSDNEVFSNSAPRYDLNITENNLDKVWYTISNGINNITIESTNGTLDENVWNALSDGPVTVIFYANDTAGNIGVTQIIVYKDSIAPIVIINSPSLGDFYSTLPPSYEISITEDNLDSIWYIIGDSTNSFKILTYTGSLDTTAWGALSNGPVIITFYVNDTAGNIGSTQTTVIKDSIAPVVIINQPETGDEFINDVPLYDIDITELNLDSVWYTMNGGINLTKITVYTGFLDEDIWNNLPNGPVTIIFYANDTAGNLGSDTIIIYKSTPSNPPPFIPGPSSLLIFFSILLGITSLSWKCFKKIRVNLE